ncbi:hypothetical protein AAK964_03425 [Tissierella praeacuta]
MNCPKCNRSVTTKKYELFYCLCGKILMVIEVNKTKMVVDHTPKKEEK